MKITIEATLLADLATVWEAWTTPEDIVQWNTASDDWCTTKAEIDLKPEGSFCYRMEAKDGNIGFDFAGQFLAVIPKERIEFKMEDDREVVIEFISTNDGVIVRETFDAETENDPELQRSGWQSVLNNFAKYVEVKSSANRGAV